MTLYTPIESIRLTSILMHKDVTRGTYIAKKEDKFIIWYDHVALIGLLDRMETYAQSSTAEWSSMIMQYVHEVSSNIKLPACRVVDSKVNRVTYETDVRTFTSNIPRTVGRSWYPTLYFHMKLYGLAPKTHSVYGKHIGWTAGLLI